MVKLIKVILAFLFVMLLQSATSDYSACSTAKVDDCIALTLPAKNIPESTVEAARSPYFPDAELAGTGIQFHQVTISRLQRISASEYLLSLKGLAQKLVNYKAALTQHWSRIYSTTTSHYCYPASEYYIFTLRRIII